MFVAPLRASSCLTILLAAGPAWAQIGQSELLGQGIARFYAPGADPAQAAPTPALNGPKAKTGDVPAAWRVKPAFSKTAEGRHRVRIEIAPGTSLYGTGEIGGPLVRNGRTNVTWNTDAYGYTPNTLSLYQSHPWVLAVRADGTAFGVLADTTWRTEIALDNGIQFTAEGREFPVIIIDRASPQEVLKGLAELSGPMPLPPLWAIGYHQCRYSYNPESRVREIAEGFRGRKIPCDVLWFDIDYMDEYKVFSFDKKQFPDPKKLNDDLGGMGFHRIWMINPGVKNQEGFAIRDELVKRDFQVKAADGSTYTGAVWPGLCVFPDYTRDDVRAWWASLYKDFMAQGIDGVWNDMNEPAIFNVASKTMPEDNKHKGGRYVAGPGVSPVTFPPGDHAQYHNAYGTLMAQATYEGIAAAKPDKRPFVLTRAGFMGSQRYAATWTGDNSANWTDLEQSIPMALTLGLSGQPFAGPDIGGFIGNGPCDPKDVACKGAFFARWMGIGALLPFSRGHAAKGNDNREPWAYTPEVEQSCKISLERRYRLIPYLYTLFYEASTSGVPVARPVFFADPTDPALRSEDDLFLLGDSLLVAPSLMPDHTRVAAMPKGLWHPVELVGDGTDPWIPKLFVKGGSIIPVGPIEEYVAQKPLDPLTLIVALDAKGEASGTLYEDAGEGFAYKSQDQFLLSTYAATRKGDEVTVRLSKTQGNQPRISRPVEVIIVTEGGKTFKASGRDGEPVTVSLR